MGCLIPIQYHKCRYPDDIKPMIKEVAGHFDVKKINVDGDYSLHTEYSFTKRKLDSDIIKKYECIAKANQSGIPKLWYSKEWSLEFVDFLKDITQDQKVPKIIEIHPPFSDYSNIKSFIDLYQDFEQKLKEFFPDVIILIENRCGTRYSGGNFIVSNIEQLRELTNEIEKQNIKLKITLDIPQLFTAHKISRVDLMYDLFKGLNSIRHYIFGIHLWGKRKNNRGVRIAHIGDLNSFFSDDKAFKKEFLECMYDVFNDRINRFFVPEVNSKSEDLHSIVNDLKKTGFRFINFI